MPALTRKVAPARPPLKEQAYREIKQRIQDGSLAGGQFLSERRLAELLKMSKTPIKAALERLEFEGFVSVSPQQGIVVRELTIQEIADQFELRKALECFVVQSIAGKLTPEQLRPIAKNLKEQAAAAKLQQVSRLVELDAEFHLRLCQAFGNAAILECMAQHRAKMHRVIYQVMSQAPNRMVDAVREHREVFAAIRDGRPKLAVELVVKHLDFGKRHLLNSKWS
jgi:DNA-binding GntR family transcriptional regulator